MLKAKVRLAILMLLFLGVLVPISADSPASAEPQPPIPTMSPEGLDLGFGDNGSVGIGDHGGFVVSDGSGGVLVVATPFTFGGPSPSLFSRRLDADGVLDESRGIVEVTREGRGLVSVLGDGAGGFYTLERELIGAESAVVVTKYDSSGHPDIAYGDGGSTRFQFMATDQEMESYIDGSFTFIMRNEASGFAVTPSGQVSVAARFDPTLELKAEEFTYVARLSPTGGLLTSSGGALVGQVYGSDTATVIAVDDESGPVVGQYVTRQSMYSIGPIVALDDGTLFLRASTYRHFADYDDVLVRVSPGNSVASVGPSYLLDSTADVSITALQTDGSSVFVAGRSRGDSHTAADTKSFLFKATSGGSLIQGFASAGTQWGEGLFPPRYIEIAPDGTIVLAGALTSFAAGFERLSAEGEPVQAWRTAAPPSGFVATNESFLAGFYGQPGASDNFSLVRGHPTGQAPGDTIELDLEAIPPKRFTDCFVLWDQPGSIQCALNQYRSFWSDGAYSAYIEVGQVGSIGMSQHSLTFLAAEACEPVWFELRRYPWDGAVTSSCPMRLATSGGADEPVNVNQVRVEYDHDFGGLDLVSNVSEFLGMQRIMFIDPASPVGNFKSTATWDPNRFGLFQQVRSPIYQASEIRNLRVIPAGEPRATIRAAFADVAYEVGAGAVRSRYFESEPGLKYYENSNVQVFNAFPRVVDSFSAKNNNLAETDSVILWVDKAGGTAGRWDPGEPFDVDVTAILQPLRIVALGDSYSAGEGATNSELHGCARSPYTYTGILRQIELFPGRRVHPEDAPTIAQIVGAGNIGPETLLRERNGTSWLYVACGGARTDSVVADDYVVNPDVDGLKGHPGPNGRETVVYDPDTDDHLVDNNVQQLGNPLLTSYGADMATISIGGNDVGFAILLKQCIIDNGTSVGPILWDAISPEPLTYADCPTVFKNLTEYADSDVDNGVEKLFNFAHLSGQEFLDQVLAPRIEATLDQMGTYLDVGGEGPRPENVYVFGYPNLIGTGSCLETGALGASANDFINELQPVVNGIIEQKAAQAGFTFVDPTLTFDPNGVCGPDLNGFVFNGEVSLPKDKSFHPTDAGYEKDFDAWLIANDSMENQGGRSATGLPYRLTGPIEPPTGGALRAGPLAAQLDQATTVFPTGGVTEPTLVCGQSTYTAGQTLTVSGNGAEGNQLVAGFVDMTAEPPVVDGFASGTVGADGNVTFDLVAPTAAGVYELAVLAAADGQYMRRSSEHVYVGFGTPDCATNDSFKISPGGSSSLDVLTNDGAGAAIVEFSDPAHGSLALVDGVLSYTPVPGYASADSFTYAVCDDTGFCSGATVTLEVTLGCDIVATDPGALLQGTSADETICGSTAGETIIGGGGTDTIFPSGGGDYITGVLAGTVNADDETFGLSVAPGVTVTGTDLPVGTIDSSYVGINDQLETLSLEGDVDLLSNDISAGSIDLATLTVTYSDPDLSVVVTGGVAHVIAAKPVVDARFTYSACTQAGVCGGAVVTVTATGQGNPPHAVDDSASTTEGVSVDVDVLANDSDPDGDLEPATLTIATPPGSGSAGAASQAGQLTYTPADGFTGSDTFVYQVCDAAGNCSQATVTVTVGAAPALPPNAVDDTAETSMDQPVDVDVLANDSDPDGDLAPATLTVTTDPSNGSATVSTDASGTDISYIPNQGFTGTDSFVYQICDLASHCSQATVTVTVINLTDVCTITGTPGADTINGTSGDDVICGLGGNDTINGRGGNDIIYGGKGSDTLRGQAGDDVIYGGPGADVIKGGAGSDVVYGGRGPDNIDGGAGADELRGNRGKDTINGRGGDDRIYGGRHDDTLWGQAGNDLMFGGFGADEIGGGPGSDILRGNNGNDILYGGDGDDAGYGGGGVDECYLETAYSCP